MRENENPLKACHFTLQNGHPIVSFARIYIYCAKIKIVNSIYFSVPADGVKGKTWGPSSGGYVLNSMASTGNSTTSTQLTNR